MILAHARCIPGAKPPPPQPAAVSRDESKTRRGRGERPAEGSLRACDSVCQFGGVVCCRFRTDDGAASRLNSLSKPDSHRPELLTPCCFFTGLQFQCKCDRGEALPQRGWSSALVPLEARQAFAESIRLKPDFAPPHYQLGKLLARANQLEPAARELEIAIRYQPDLAEAYYQLSRVYPRLGENAKSQRALVAFSQLKKETADESSEFMEEVRKQLELQ